MVNVQIEQQVKVTDGHGRAKATVYDGTVVKVGRVWIDVHKDGQQWGWRFRKDTQTDGSNFGHRPRFYTLEQWATKQRQDSAEAYLREQGIDVRYDSPWRERMTELAKTIGWTPPV
jgi:hypothetical protein